jgi:hypothetical protein
MLSMEGVDWRIRASSAARSWSWKGLRRLVGLGKEIPGRWDDIIAAAALLELRSRGGGVLRRWAGWRGEQCEKDGR